MPPNPQWYCAQCLDYHPPERSCVASAGGTVTLTEYAVNAFHAATTRMEQAQRDVLRAARDRVLALKALSDRAELSHNAIGALVGLSGTRVSQLLAKETRDE